MIRYLIWGCLAFSVAAMGQTKNLAEQLGYAPDTKLLIVHADDVGMAHSVNAATVEAFKAAMIRTGSVMVPCPWFPEIAAYAREHPDADLGLHLTLTSEWKYYRWRPVSPITEVPGLVDEEGYLWRRVEDVVKHASPAEVEKELRAQIERALAFGMQPTHLDTHMGTVYASPAFFEIYHRLGVEYGIPVMLINLTPEKLAFYRAQGYPITDAMVRQLRQSTMPKLDTLVTGVPNANDLESRRQAYYDLFERLQPGVTQLIVHLGGDDPELRAITGNWKARYDDFRIFTDPRTRQKLEALNIRLIGWRPLYEWYQKGQQQSAGEERAR